MNNASISFKTTDKTAYAIKTRKKEILVLTRPLHVYMKFTFLLFYFISKPVNLSIKAFIEKHFLLKIFFSISCLYILFNVFVPAKVLIGIINLIQKKLIGQRQRIVLCSEIFWNVIIYEKWNTIIWYDKNN